MSSKPTSRPKTPSNTNGGIRRVHSDTRVGTLREIYGDDFARGYRSDAKVSTLLEEAHAKSLKDFIRHEIFKQTESTYGRALRRLANK